MALALIKFDDNRKVIDDVVIDEYTASPVTRQVDGVDTKLWLIRDCENGDAYYVRRQDRAGYVAVGLSPRVTRAGTVFTVKHMNAMAARNIWEFEDRVPSFWYSSVATATATATSYNDAPVPTISSQKRVNTEDYVYRSYSDDEDDSDDEY